MHIVVINPTNGEVCWAIVFDTYKSSDDLNEFILKGLPAGYIVVAACKDECSTNMSVHARILFTDMGSQEIWKIERRQGYVFVGIMGNKEANEKRAVYKKEIVSIQ